MPKVKTSVTVRGKNYVTEFGEHIFAFDGSVLFCKICEVKIKCEKRFSVTQHLSTEKHIRASNRQNKNATQQLITTPTRKSDFFKDLCEAFLKSNIPLEKLGNPHLRLFLEKYINKDIPSVSTLRKTYVNDCYEDTMNEIRNQILNKKIWVSIDETTDTEGRYVANVIIGTLLTDGPGKKFLIASEVLEKANHTTISKLFDRTLFTLWPNGINHDDVILFVTDAAPYMVKAAKSIQVFYSKMIHITCLAHGLHRVCEKNRAEFPKVDELILNMKKVFLKAPARVELFRREAPETPLPLSPIITRWGTWLKDAMYYCENFKAIKKVVHLLDADDALAIRKVKKIMSETDLESYLAFIYTNYGFLTTAITCLETQGTLLTDAIKTVENNLGFKILTKISKVMLGEEISMDNLSEDISCDDLLYFKYAPISSVDVERSFSVYKNMLADNRRSFKFENLSKSLIAYGILAKINWTVYTNNKQTNIKLREAKWKSCENQIIMTKFVHSTSEFRMTISIYRI
ncbi:hypothetical protein AGLY_017381 [Aphis glycines]|uniref:DUF659 domain-containing protein n=1 Tax=Aphis glycines TaxID=307491 RepID=A0A6G0SV36_APHGL|nr:hypothetical protein AGLY_017381 [Aphis glycines]